MEDDEHTEFVENWGDDYAHYTHNISVWHYIGTINGDGEHIEGKTPFGECYSTEMWCEMEGLPTSFLDEDEIFVLGWSDG